jgi:starch phosphorylase
MVAEYMSELYQPAHQQWINVSADAFKVARQKTTWDERVRETWHQVRFIDLGDGPDELVTSGSAVPVRATLELGGLDPSEVRVEAVVGEIGIGGDLQNTTAVTLIPVGKNGTATTFANEFTVQQTGRVGYSLRISPNHFDIPLTRPCNSLLKWVSD